MNAARKPSAGWYGVALGVFLLFGIAVPAACTVFLVGSIGGGQQFRVPGKTTFTADEPGTYVLWNEISTFYEGRSYSPGDSLPDGMEVAITDPEGRSLALTPDRSASMQSGGSSSRSIGTFPVSRAGTLTIEVSGKFPDRIFFVRKSVIERVLTSVVCSIVSGVIGLVGSSLVAVFVFLRRNRAAAAG